MLRDHLPAAFLLAALCAGVSCGQRSQQPDQSQLPQQSLQSLQPEQSQQLQQPPQFQQQPQQFQQQQQPQQPQQSQGDVYRDPNGRFSVTIPAGWTAAPQGEALMITHGATYVLITPVEGVGSGREVVATLGQQYSSQWRNLSSAGRGDYSIGGQPGAYEMFSGVNPKGVPAVLRIAGIMAGGQAWAVIGSSPQSELADAKSALQSIDPSITFGGGTPGSNGSNSGQHPPDQAPSFGQPNGQPNYPPNGQPRYQPNYPPNGQPNYPPNGQPNNQPNSPSNFQPTSARGGSTVPGGDQSGYYRMHWVRLMDQHGFGQPVEMARLLVPVDWRFEGGIQWGPTTGCTPNLIHVVARATSPDGTSAIEFFTPYMWQWHDDPENRRTIQGMQQMAAALRPCAMQQPVGAADYIRKVIVPRYRSGAQVVSVERLPQIAQAKQTLMQEQNASNVQAGLVTGVRADAGRVALAYQVNGRPVEEWITGTVEIVARPAPSASAAMNGGSEMVRSYDITANDLTAVRAPAGELARRAKLYATIVGSVRPNIHWIVAAQQIEMNINRAGEQGAIDRAGIWKAAQDQISATIVSQYQAQQGVQDRLAGEYSQSVRGRETFIDPSSNERVELTGGYQQAWSNGQGEYILSDNPNFDPARSLHEQWTELRRP